jgi:hypothetical protein
MKLILRLSVLLALVAPAAAQLSLTGVGGGSQGSGGAALACSYTPVTTGTQSAAYTGGTPSASGGTPTYTFSETGALPTGITINTTTGVLSGTPSVSGTFAGIQVKVTDSLTTVSNCGSSFTLTIAASGGGCTESANYLSGLTTSFTSAYQTMICGMVTDGDFAKMEFFYVLATDNTANALKDIVRLSTASITGTANFTANSGYVPTGNATLNTGFNYSTGTKYLQNSAFISAWTTGTSNDNNCPIGEASLSSDIKLQVFDFGGNAGGSINTGGVSGAVANANGLSALERTGATAVFVTRNGISVATGTAASAAPSNTTAQGFECAGSGSTYVGNVAMLMGGGSLTVAGQLRVYNRIHTFLTAVNSSLFP